MAHSLSAKKRHRQSLRRQERNVARKTEARSAVRKAREAIDSGNKDEAAEAVRKASKVLDRVAAKGIVHRNNARRRKARLSRALSRGSTGAGQPKQRSAS